MPPPGECEVEEGGGLLRRAHEVYQINDSATTTSYGSLLLPVKATSSSTSSSSSSSSSSSASGKNTTAPAPAAAAATATHPSPFTAAVEAARRRSAGRWSMLSIALTVVILSGTANLIFYKLVFDAFGEDGAFAVSQIVNLLYVVIGGAALLPRMLFTDHITPEMRQLPQKRFLVMGFLDCCGTFLGAMGSVYTPGQVQTLLNQTLIPATMLVSAAYLGTRFSRLQLTGAALVLLGAAMVVIPSLLNPDLASGETRTYAVVIYLLSNIPVACSQVYKERSFKRKEKVDVLYLMQWVAVWQLAFGFVLAPLQMLPGVGSAHGVPLGHIISSTKQGTACWLELSPECKEKHTFWLLLGYVCANFVYNVSGLYVSKHGSAVVSSLSFAALLPLTTLAFCFRPLLGRYTEKFQVTTLVGLVVVMAGFYTYETPVLEDEVELQRLSQEAGRRVTVEEMRAMMTTTTASAASATTDKEQKEEGGEEEALAGRRKVSSSSSGHLLLGLEQLLSRPPTPVLVTVDVPSFQERVVAGLGPMLLRPHVIDSPAPLAILRGHKGGGVTAAGGGARVEEAHGGDGGDDDDFEYCGHNSKAVMASSLPDHHSAHHCKYSL